MMEQLELLYIHPSGQSNTFSKKRTEKIVIQKDKPRSRRPAFSIMRRGAAFCLSIGILACTPAAELTHTDSKLSDAVFGLVFQNEMTGYSLSYRVADLPILSFTDQLHSQLQNHLVQTPSDSILKLDSGLNFPANYRYTDGILQPCQDYLTTESVRELTVAPTSTYGYDVYQNIYVLNGSGKTLNLPELLQETLQISSFSTEPLVYIYHTHTCEAYTPGSLDTYKTDDSDRCTDSAYNVVRIGEEITKALQAHGIGVIHDTTMYDSPSYSGAYQRSLAAVQQAIQEHPTIQIVIDVHRDALNQPDSQKYKLVTETDEGKTAQVMMVIGTDAAAGDHPNWKENLKLALRIQQQMVEHWPALARPIKLTRSSYNQFTAIGAMIVEVGANGNELSEAIRAGRFYAEALAAILSVDAGA